MVLAYSNACGVVYCLILTSAKDFQSAIRRSVVQGWVFALYRVVVSDKKLNLHIVSLLTQVYHDSSFLLRQQFEDNLFSLAGNIFLIDFKMQQTDSISNTVNFQIIAIAWSNQIGKTFLPSILTKD